MPSRSRMVAAAATRSDGSMREPARGFALDMGFGPVGVLGPEHEEDLIAGGAPHGISHGEFFKRRLVAEDLDHGGVQVVGVAVGRQVHHDE